MHVQWSKGGLCFLGQWQVEHWGPRGSDPICVLWGAYLPSSMKSMARVLMMKTHRPAMNMW